MKRIFMLLAAGAVLVGCDYKVALLQEPVNDIDKSIIGTWLTEDEHGETKRMQVLPYSSRQYLVVNNAGTKDEMFARGMLWRKDGLALIQLEWLPQENDEQENNFQFALYECKDNLLRVRLLNPDVVANNIDTAEKLEKAILSNRENGALFREVTEYRKRK